MWNQMNTAAYQGMLAETISIQGYAGDDIRAYIAKPLGEGSFPGIVLIPHMPGWDEWCRETARRFAQHGYTTLCPDIYSRFGEGTPGEVAQRAREAGLSDESVMGDVKGARDYIRAQPQSNEKVGVIGMCSGGRHAYLAACSVGGFDAVVDCWGGMVVMTPEQLSPLRPVAPIDVSEKLDCPLLGIFGNDDQHPSPQQVDLHEAELKRLGKNYSFHRYDGAGHGFWYYDRDAYRPAQAMDSWGKTLAFFSEHLS